MKSIPLAEFQTNPMATEEIKETLESGGLVCFPSSSGYKIAADLFSPAAITAILQAKRRVKNAPALVFMPDDSWVPKVAAHVSEAAEKLIKAFWPGSVTLLVEAHEDIHPKIRKQLTKAKGWLGIRVPGDTTSLAVTRAFGRPILVSSANLAKKHGEQSLAQVKKNFGRTAALVIDDGDLALGPKSTLVDVSNGSVQVVRIGAVSEDEIAQSIA